MLSLVLLAYDPIAVWSLVIAAIALLFTVIAAIAAIAAAIYAKKSPTANDLARVEQNTAHLEEVRTTIASVDNRLKKQEDAKSRGIRANRVSIAASGNQSGTAPYPLQLLVREPKEPNLSLTHIELCNEPGTSFGSFQCSQMGDPSLLNFRADIPMAAMGEWFQAGTPVQTLSRVRLKLRVWMSMDGFEVYRDMPVTIVDTSSSGGMAGYILNGRV
jgi:hypothetical protein